MCFREETVGHRPVSGDEHTVQVLVFLPEGQLQQEDVRGVQTVRGGRRQRKQQVRKRRLNRQPSSFVNGGLTNICSCFQ